jgi:hypothetical protein
MQRSEEEVEKVIKEAYQNNAAPHWMMRQL